LLRPIVARCQRSATWSYGHQRCRRMSLEDIHRDIDDLEKQVNDFSSIKHSGSLQSSRKGMPTIKLSGFDGSMPLQSHLAKFENCSFYYGWIRRRDCYHKNSLAQATHVLWQLPATAGEADVIKLLRNRQGNGIVSRMI